MTVRTLSLSLLAAWLLTGSVQSAQQTQAITLQPGWNAIWLEVEPQGSDGLPLRPFFDAVVDASMIHRGKPDPEIYLTAAQRLGVEPGRCVVFEDALAGIEAGIRAGMQVVALATTHTHEELADTGAALIVDDFTQLTAASVQALIPPA